MKIGLMLALGDSFEEMAKTGQDVQFKKYYLKPFSESFEKIYVFSYGWSKPKDLPKNVEVLINKKKMNRFFYAFLMPFIYKKQIREIDALRAYHLSGTIPAIIVKLLFNKNFVFNFAFNYKKFALIEKKYIQLILLYLLEPVAFLFAKKIFIANKKNVIKSNKGVFLPNGVDINVFQPKREQIDDKQIRILSVGRLGVQKNYSILIDAIKGLNVKLTLVGRGEEKLKLIENARKNNVDLNIIESIPNEELPKLYNWANVFVLPSKIEGHPKALLEAMSSGLPVIGTNVEGITEVINNQKNGLISALSAKSLRVQLKKLIKSPRLRNLLGMNARAKIIDSFNLNNLIQEEIRAIRNL